MKPIFDNMEYLEIGEGNDDYFHARSFLYSYRGSTDTFNSYRRDVERLFHYCNYINKTLKEIKKEDIEHFIEFCQKPPDSWIANKHENRYLKYGSERRINPNWRPFRSMAGVFKFSYTSTQALFATLNSFFEYLVQNEYILVNPVRQIRQKSKFLRKQQIRRNIRRLTLLQWQYVLDAARELANNDKKHERTLFIVTALYCMYLRISELASTARWQPLMCHFHKDNDGYWWFKTVGKGNKERDISVSDAMLEALKRYRLSLYLSPLPSEDEEIPLVCKYIGEGGIAGTSTIRQIVEQCFLLAIQKMNADKKEDEAKGLEKATVHWLRHTGISEDVKYRPREHVRDDAGHSSILTTDKYIDVTYRERHASKRLGV